MDWISLNQIRVKFVAYKYIYIYIVEEKEREGGGWRYLDSLADKRRKKGKTGEEGRGNACKNANEYEYLKTLRRAFSGRDLSMIFAADHRWTKRTGNRLAVGDSLCA